MRESHHEILNREGMARSTSRRGLPDASQGALMKMSEVRLTKNDSPTFRAKPGPSQEILSAIERLQAGKDVDRSFHLIYDTYFQQIRRLFERRGVSLEDRPDLIQKTFFRIYKGIKGLKEPSRFEPFLRTTAQRVFLKWLKRANSQGETHGGRVRVAPEDEEILDFLVSDEPWAIPLRPSASPEAELAYKKLVERIVKAIDEMPPAMGRCARLRFVQGLTNKEITEVLRKKPGDVGYQLFQARKRLSEILRGDQDSGQDT